MSSIVWNCALSVFTPRWTAGHWTGFHVWADIVADVAIGLAYLAIPIIMIYFVRRHPDIPFPRLFWLFAAFILSCGIGHWVDATLFWHPWYGLSTGIKIITAAASWVALVALVPALPHALALPGLRHVVQRLEDEVRQREEQERRLQAYATELEQRNGELDRFTYVASHDLQEPVRKMVAFGELLRRDIHGSDDARIVKDIDYIVDASLRMRRLIDDLLRLSRAGRTAIARESVALSQCVQAALTSLEMVINERRADITVDPMPSVSGDRTLLTQLFQNLVSNAVKFVPSDRPPRVHITAHGGPNNWIFGVRDNGIGIPEQEHARVFRAFERLHGRNEYEGSGIGLAICELAVRRHGGRIWIETLGQGSYFKFTLGEQESELPIVAQEDVMAASS